MRKNLHLNVLILLTLAFFTNFVLKASAVINERPEYHLVLEEDDTLVHLEQDVPLKAKSHLQIPSIPQSSFEEEAVDDVNDINNKDHAKNSYIIFASVCVICVMAIFIGAYFVIQAVIKQTP